MEDTGNIPPMVQSNVSTKARPPHRLLLITFLARIVTIFLSSQGGFFASPKARCARPDVTLHSASVTGRPIRHVRSKHSVAMKVAIVFAYIQCRALPVEMVVSTCKTPKLIKTLVICYVISYDQTC